jgi:hypothetical protein
LVKEVVSFQGFGENNMKENGGEGEFKNDIFVILKENL